MTRCPTCTHIDPVRGCSHPALQPPDSDAAEPDPCVGSASTELGAAIEGWLAIRATVTKRDPTTGRILVQRAHDCPGRSRPEPM